MTRRDVGTNNRSGSLRLSTAVSESNQSLSRCRNSCTCTSWSLILMKVFIFMAQIRQLQIRRRICRSGFHARFSSEIYGRGFYFTPDFYKRMQYTSPCEDGICTVLVARVVVGDGFRASEACSHARRPPEREDAQPGVLYDSIIACP